MDGQPGEQASVPGRAKIGFFSLNHPQPPILSTIRFFLG